MTQGRPFWEKNISPVKYTERGYFCVKEPTNSTRETRKAATCNERSLQQMWYCGSSRSPYQEQLHEAGDCDVLRHLALTPVGLTLTITPLSYKICKLLTAQYYLCEDLLYHMENTAERGDVLPY